MALADTVTQLQTAVTQTGNAVASLQAVQQTVASSIASLQGAVQALEQQGFGASSGSVTAINAAITALQSV